MKYLYFILTLFIVLPATAQKKFSHKISFGSSYVVGQERDNDIGGYSSDNTVGYLGLKFDYVASFNLNPYLSIGPGFGIRHLINFDDQTSSNFSWDNTFDYTSYFALPVYLNMNLRFIDKKVSPFVGLSAGYSFSLNSQDLYAYGFGDYTKKIKSGFMMLVNPGVSISFRNGMAISAGPYFEFQPSKILESGGTHGIDNKINQYLYHFGLQANLSF